MIQPTDDYTNRLNAVSSPLLEKAKKLYQSIQSSTSKTEGSSGSFQDVLNEEINKQLNGKVTSSAIKRPGTIKEDVANDPERKKLYNACVEFESIFVKMMLNQMKKSVDKSGFIDGGHAEEIFEDMLYDEYAKQISKNESLGLAEQIYDSLSAQLPAVRKPD